MIVLCTLQEISRKDRELEATIKRPAEADKYKMEKLAEANRLVIMCGSRKYPYRHHRGNWKFQRGGGLTVKLTSRWFSLIQYRPTAVVVRNCYLPTLMEHSEVGKGFAKELFPPSAHGRP